MFRKYKNFPKYQINCKIENFRKSFFGRKFIILRKAGSWVVINTVRSFGEIQLTIFEKYSKGGRELEFWSQDRREDDRGGIAHFSSWNNFISIFGLCFK